MKFTRKWPSGANASGYYWVVNVDYPVPQICFILQDDLWITCREKPVHHRRDAESSPDEYGIRIGDKIENIPCTDVEICNETV